MLPYLAGAFLISIYIYDLKLWREREMEEKVSKEINGYSITRKKVVRRGLTVEKGGGLRQFDR